MAHLGAAEYLRSDWLRDDHNWTLVRQANAFYMAAFLFETCPDAVSGVCMCVCVCARVFACARMCVCECECACVYLFMAMSDCVWLDLMLILLINNYN